MFLFDARRLSLAGVFLTLTALPFIGPCSSEDGEADRRDTITGTGTLHLVQVEGGCWELRTDDEDEFEVVNLEAEFPEFREDGLRVRFAGEIRDDMATICQLGTDLELRELERLE